MKQACKCDDNIRDVFVDVCMCRREYAALLPKDYIVNASKLEDDSIRDKNGVDIDYQKIHNLFVQNRNIMYLDGDGEIKCSCVSCDVWESDWEKGLCQLVAWLYIHYTKIRKVHQLEDWMGKWQLKHRMKWDWSYDK